MVAKGGWEVGRRKGGVSMNKVGFWKGKWRAAVLLALAAMLAAGLLPGLVIAHDGPFCEFCGFVTVSGENVPVGSVVTGRISDPLVDPDPKWSTEVYELGGDSWYSLQIPRDNTSTPQKEGGLRGDKVYFTLRYNGFDVLAPSSVWQGGSVLHNLHLSVIIGDANGDGIVDILDLITVKWMIVDPVNHPPSPGADANQDGKVDILDITKIEQIILGIDC
jgi:hypothetical protein